MANEAQLRTVPKAALAFDVGPLQFAAPAESGNVPVKIRARSAQPINHWYWGKAVHDMAGFTPAAPSIPLDYCHNDAEILGYADKFEPSNDGLDVAGELVPFTDQDRASEVIHKQKAKVPYQASIYFGMEGLVIEEVGFGAKVQVNGFELEGPGIVFRKWTLRGVAVCPYGYDLKTQTKLAAGPLAGEIEVPVTQLSANPMDKNTKPAETTPTTQPATELTPPTTQPTVDPRAEFKATLAKFTEKFGAENGAKWAAEGLTYEAALEQHSAALATRLTAETAKVTELNGKLATVPRGEATPVSFGTNEKHEGGNTVPQKFAHCGKLGAFAASLKLPGAAAK